MLNPEFTNGIIVVRKGEAVLGEGMGEEGRIEVEAKSLFLRPVDPALEMGHLELVPVHHFAIELAVTGVEIQSVFAGEERVNLFEILPQFVRSAGATRIVARHGNSAAQASFARFESSDVIPLPAMH